MNAPPANLAASAATPFFILNAVVAGRIEPAFSLIRPEARSSPQEYALLAAALLVMPVGALLALRHRPGPGPPSSWP